jgi:antitoxin (DNA-binding transcriptional repressor) of toxin-antitoxin stability system
MDTAKRTPVCMKVLHLTHMDTIGVRELQQHASSALRRVERGETLGVTDRGRLIAVLTPPSAATGAGALLASGRVQPARRPISELPEPIKVAESTSDVLDDLRSDR